jgi:hypothetical protein
MVRGRAHRATGLRHRSENTSLHLLGLRAARLCLIIRAHLDFKFSAPRPASGPGRGCSMRPPRLPLADNHATSNDTAHSSASVAHEFPQPGRGRKTPGTGNRPPLARTVIARRSAQSRRTALPSVAAVGAAGGTCRPMIHNGLHRQKRRRRVIRQRFSLIPRSRLRRKDLSHPGRRAGRTPGLPEAP